MTPPQVTPLRSSPAEREVQPVATPRARIVRLASGRPTPPAVARVPGHGGRPDTAVRPKSHQRPRLARRRSTIPVGRIFPGSQEPDHWARKWGSSALLMMVAVRRSRMTENSLETVVAVPVGGPGSSKVRENRKRGHRTCVRHKISRLTLPDKVTAILAEKSQAGSRWAVGVIVSSYRRAVGVRPGGQSGSAGSRGLAVVAVAGSWGQT